MEKQSEHEISMEGLGGLTCSDVGRKRIFLPLPPLLMLQRNTALALLLFPRQLNLSSLLRQRQMHAATEQAAKEAASCILCAKATLVQNAKLGAPRTLLQRTLDPRSGLSFTRHLMLEH